MKKKIKAWALVDFEGELCEGVSYYYVFTQKNDAERNQKSYKEEGYNYKVIPVEITYDFTRSVSKA